MAVVDVVTPDGHLGVTGEGYRPTGTITGPATARTLAVGISQAALDCVHGAAVERNGEWVPDGDAMEAAIHCFALRCGVADRRDTLRSRQPFTAARMLSSSTFADGVSVLGAPESVLARCRSLPETVYDDLDALTRHGRRVVAVARRTVAAAAADAESDLTFLGLLGLEDPPRPDVDVALAACRRADIRVAMITGDHPSTAEAIARDIGLLGPGGVVLSAADLPTDDEELGALLDRPDGAVVARVTPADKFRIARVLRDRGHVVAMTGDGVNDAPAMREADVGVAMGASGATSRASPPTSSSSTITSARSSPRSSWGGPRSRTSSAS